MDHDIHRPLTAADMDHGTHVTLPSADVDHDIHRPLSVADIDHGTHPTLPQADMD